jgi:excisionase family DNA binding protein
MPTAPVTWTPSAQAALKRLDGRIFATVTEAGAVLRYDHRTVRAAIGRGEIPAIKHGKTWRIPVAWLLKVAALGTDESTEAG